FEIDTDVMYQWRDIVPTFETAITKISDICIRHAKAEQSEAIFELSGDEREPIRDIRIEDVHVGLLTQFESRTSFVEGLTVRNVVYDKMDAADGNMSISGIAPGR
ncbi:MAG: hypothetical protein IJS25_01350, partial [Bacteroidales bacterium]|nr:hypothetical protein [Bacteroidales bacterium]